MTKHVSKKSRATRIAMMFGLSALVGAGLGAGLAYGAIAIGVNL